MVRACWLPPLVVLAIGGCGGSDRVPSAEVPAPVKRAVPAEKADYVRRANAICSRHHAELRRVGQPAGDIEQQASIARKINVVQRRETAALRRLDAPAADRPRLEALFRDTDRMLALADSTTRTLSVDPVGTNARFAKAVSLLDDVNRRLRAYGLTTCAE